MDYMQEKKLIVCRDCGQTYLGHHLTKECDKCRFKECRAPGCTTKIKKSIKKSYCSADCKASDPAANKMDPSKRKQAICACGQTFQQYSGSGRSNPGSKRQYCSDECRKRYYWRPPTSDEQKAKISAAKKGKPLTALRGHKQSDEHLRRRLGTGAIKPSSHELELVPVLAKYGYEHVGDGNMWRRWPDGTPHNPDFINREKRALVEYFGYVWHEDDWGREEYIREQWKALGYYVLIIWDVDRNAFIADPEAWGINDPESWTGCKDINNRPDKVGTNSWAQRGGRQPKPIKTHCPRGHLLQDPNLVPRRTYKECLACSQALRIVKAQPSLSPQAVSNACHEEITRGVPNPYRRPRGRHRKKTLIDEGVVAD